MELILVRHAQPIWLHDGLGLDDPPLTALGRRQAARLGEVAAGWSEIEALWVSPLLRARQTAAPLSAALGLEPVELPWLAEVGLPPREGRTVEDLEPVLKGFRRRGVAAWWEGFPGGEDLRTFVQRVGGGLGETLAARGARRREVMGLWSGVAREGRVVVVCHAGTIAVLMSHLLSLPQVPWAWERFPVGHASVTRLLSVGMAGGAIFSLRAYSDQEPHPAEERTR